MGVDDDSCGWPFHQDPDCAECREWDVKYDKALIEAFEWRKQKRK